MDADSEQREGARLSSHSRQSEVAGLSRLSSSSGQGHDGARLSTRSSQGEDAQLARVSMITRTSRKRHVPQCGACQSWEDQAQPFSMRTILTIWYIATHQANLGKEFAHLKRRAFWKSGGLNRGFASDCHVVVFFRSMAKNKCSSEPWPRT
eukprot:6142229-Amphidinium_carterae.2